MLVVSLTTIPPRFDTVGRTLETILAQRPRPDVVRVTVPRRYLRFPDWDGTPPALPTGATLHRSAEDLGPATKALPAAAALRDRGARLVWCDDDWLYGDGWLAELTGEAATYPDAAVAGSGFPARRLGLRARVPDPGFTDIAQGFSGVLVRPKMLPAGATAPPAVARYADDVWLSGLLAAAGVPIRLAPAARAACLPHAGDAAALQSARPDGHGRAAANFAAAAELRRRYGLWA